MAVTSLVPIAIMLGSGIIAFGLGGVALALQELVKAQDRANVIADEQLQLAQAQRENRR